MVNRLGPVPQVQGADTVARSVAALGLAALAVIHVVDLPATLGPTPLVGTGYFAIIAAAVVTAGVLIIRTHWLAWAAACGVAIAAMGGYVLTRSIPGGFLGDHTDVGNWRCPLGMAALSVEAILILLVALTAWQSRGRARRVAPQPLPDSVRRRVPEFSGRRPG